MGVVDAPRRLHREVERPGEESTVGAVRPLVQPPGPDHLVQ